MSTHRPHPLFAKPTLVSLDVGAWRDLERPESFQQESASAGTDEDIQALIAYIRSRLAAGRATVPYGEYIHRDELMSAIPEHSGGIPRERVETFFRVTRLKGAGQLGNRRNAVEFVGQARGRRVWREGCGSSGRDDDGGS